MSGERVKYLPVRGTDIPVRGTDIDELNVAISSQDLVESQEPSSWARRVDGDIVIETSDANLVHPSNNMELVEAENLSGQEPQVLKNDDDYYVITKDPKAILRVIPGVLSMWELQALVDRDIEHNYWKRKWGLLGYTIITIAAFILALTHAGSNYPHAEQTLCLLSFFFFVATFWTLFYLAFHRRLHPVLWVNPQLSLTVWTSAGMYIGNIGFSITFAFCIAAQALTGSSLEIVLIVLWFLLSMTMAFFIYFPFTQATKHTVSVASLALMLLIILILEVTSCSTNALRWFEIALSFNIVGIIVMVGEEVLVSLAIPRLNPFIYNNQLYYLFSILSYYIGLISRSFE